MFRKYFKDGLFDKGDVQLYSDNPADDTRQATLDEKLTDYWVEIEEVGRASENPDGV